MPDTQQRRLPMQLAPPVAPDAGDPCPPLGLTPHGVTSLEKICSLQLALQVPQCTGKMVKYTQTGILLPTPSLRRVDLLAPTVVAPSDFYALILRPSHATPNRQEHLVYAWP